MESKPGEKFLSFTKIQFWPPFLEVLRSLSHSKLVALSGHDTTVYDYGGTRDADNFFETFLLSGNA